MTATCLQCPQLDGTGVLGRLQIWCVCVCVCVLGMGVLYILYISNNNHMIKKKSKWRLKKEITQLFDECATSVEDYSESSKVSSKCLLEAGGP